MCWIWTSVYGLKEGVYADVKHGTGDVTTNDITSTRRFDPELKPPIATIDDKITTRENIIFASHRNPLVSKRMVDIIRQYTAADDVDYLKAAFLPDNLVDEDFFFVRPLIEKECTDIENSSLRWIHKNVKLYSDFDQIRFLKGCMGLSNIVRDSYGRHVVVSDELKQVLDPVFDIDGLFVRPEDHISLRAMQMK